MPFQPGIMIEVRSAAIMADELAREVDFFSIGTNDLSQHLNACDRTNPALAGLEADTEMALLRVGRTSGREMNSAKIEALRRMADALSIGA